MKCAPPKIVAGGVPKMFNFNNLNHIYGRGSTSIQTKERNYSTTIVRFARCFKSVTFVQ